MFTFTDQTGHTIQLRHFPRRIISLVPSQTELLAHLDLHDEVVGITKFCIHPDDWFRSKTRIGGTKKINFEKIQQLQPDLIIANKEENVKEEVEILSTQFPVWASDCNNLTQACDMIIQLGVITGKQKKAIEIVKQIQEKFAQLHAPIQKRRAAYLIWQNPLMTIGGDTFINDMMEMAGFENVFKKEKRYPETTIEQMKEAQCEILMLSSEPYPFAHKHLEYFKKELPETKIILVDGEMFSWYGSRLINAPAYFQQLQQEIAISDT